MKKSMVLFLLLVIFFVTACAPQEAATSLPVTEPAVSSLTDTPVAVPPSEVDLPAAWSQYANSIFGLSFEYPPDWFGPDEYVSNQTLRVAIGSDTVYPYGTDRTEQIYEVSNSYYITIQFTRNDQNQVWNETYQSLISMQDGESISDARSLVIRVRELNLGSFTGFEYITTLSDTAQTEPVYIRQVILFDDQSNILTIMGSPNNVEISEGTGWREAYENVDLANLDLFHQIVDSLTVD